MPSFLISIPYIGGAEYICEKEGLPPLGDSDEIAPRLISLYINADTEDEALQWAAYIGDQYSRVVEDVPDWNERGFTPYVERNPAEAGLVGIDSFLQKVRIGEEPRYADMTESAYVQWLEDNWRET